MKTLWNINALRCLRRPAAAAAASLATVTLITALLGAVFLPKEIGWLTTPDYVSVTHCLVPQADRPIISLFWSIAPIGMPGWRHNVRIHESDDAPRTIACAKLDLKPLSLAEGPDVDHFFVGNWDGAIHLLDTRRPESQPVLIGRQADGGVVALKWSAGGRCLVSQSAFQFYAWDLNARQPRWHLDNIAPYSFAIHPDAPIVIVSTLSGSLSEIDLRDGTALRTLARYDEPALAVSFSPSGEQVAVQNANGRLMLLDWRTGRPLWNENPERTCQTAGGRFVTFSPCGTMLVTAGQTGGTDLSVWSISTGQRLRVLRGHRKMVSGAAFSANGLLHSWGADGTIRTWDLRTGATLQVASLGNSQPAT